MCGSQARRLRAAAGFKQRPVRACIAGQSGRRQPLRVTGWGAHDRLLLPVSFSLLKPEGSPGLCVFDIHSCLFLAISRTRCVWPLFFHETSLSTARSRPRQLLPIATALLPSTRPAPPPHRISGPAKRQDRVTAAHHRLRDSSLALLALDIHLDHTTTSTSAAEIEGHCGRPCRRSTARYVLSAPS